VRALQLTAYGKLEPGELAMQQEILARGPIVCGIACPDDFTYHYHSSKNNGECVPDAVGAGPLTTLGAMERCLLLVPAARKAFQHNNGAIHIICTPSS